MTADIMFLKMVKWEDVVRCQCGSGRWNRWIDRTGKTWCVDCMYDIPYFWREVHTEEELQSEVTVQEEIDKFFASDDEMLEYQRDVDFDDGQRHAKEVQQIQYKDDCTNSLED